MTQSDLRMEMRLNGLCINLKGHSLIFHMELSLPKNPFDLTRELHSEKSCIQCFLELNRGLKFRTSLQFGSFFVSFLLVKEPNSISPPFLTNGQKKKHKELLHY